MTEAMTKDVESKESSTDNNPQFLKVITVPLTKLIIEVRSRYQVNVLFFYLDKYL